MEPPKHHIWTVRLIVERSINISDWSMDYEAKTRTVCWTGQLDGPGLIGSRSTVDHRAPWLQTRVITRSPKCLRVSTRKMSAPLRNFDAHQNITCNTSFHIHSPSHTSVSALGGISPFLLGSRLNDVSEALIAQPYSPPSSV